MGSNRRFHDKLRKSAFVRCRSTGKRMSTKKATILTVDDEEHVRMLLQKILEQAGYDVVTASSGKEALEKVCSGDISLVLLDIMMPEMDGFETLKLIREESEVPVIMVTGIGEPTSASTTPAGSTPKR